MAETKRTVSKTPQTTKMSDAEYAAQKRRENFAKLKEVLIQNVKKSTSKTFTQYTKELIKTYMRNPASYLDSIREVSAYLARTSMIYKKILAYFSQMPLFYYNLTYKCDFTKGVDSNKMLSSYQDVSQKLQQIKMCIRDRVDVIQASETPVYTVCFSDCASMGFHIFISGHKRYAFKNSILLIHDGEITVNNSSSKAKDTMKFFETLDKRIKNHVTSSTKITNEFYDSIYDKEYYIYANEEGKELGCVDYIIGEDVPMSTILVE